jgi:hypothetical protein
VRCFNSSRWSRKLCFVIFLHIEIDCVNALMYRSTALKINVMLSKHCFQTWSLVATFSFLTSIRIFESDIMYVHTANLESADKFKIKRSDKYKKHCWIVESPNVDNDSGQRNGTYFKSNPFYRIQNKIILHNTRSQSYGRGACTTPRIA